MEQEDFARAERLRAYQAGLDTLDAAARRGLDAKAADLEAPGGKQAKVAVSP